MPVKSAVCGGCDRATRIAYELEGRRPGEEKEIGPDVRWECKCGTTGRLWYDWVESEWRMWEGWRLAEPSSVRDVQRRDVGRGVSARAGHPLG
ncbi:hypothetical protein HUG10_21190 (plasmid) [Halorarum halophilum]|uniref:Uncharacterized protein n=1 Tax=Halorarum halophilum TaxID=2743090 RepID=A0A7D5GQ19_9EURY|nr:hypothetical protein [Halobaculum halophilum]QLG30104.1 hypothetical protein HUG10_21190 [Halobaculum halophilum]